ncbi:MAG: class I SAM-dependent methyltransferase [Pirellulales bacterium]|nr:class I SAM-dependent methyltransferase [Pirellulales bacterium]
MPREQQWETYFDPAAILRTLGLSATCRDVVEFGCGYGTFTIPAARIVSGTVYALDIDGEMVDRTAERCQESELTNVRAIRCDFLQNPLPTTSADYAMLFNILHAEQPEQLLECARCALGPGGRLGIMHWRYDSTTPRGPSMAIRPKPEQCQHWAASVGFVAASEIVELPPYHYGFVVHKSLTE